MNKPHPSLFEAAAGEAAAGGAGGAAAGAGAASGAGNGQGGAAAGAGQLAQKPWYSDWVQEGGKLFPGALDKLPDDLKDLKGHLGLFQTFDDFLKSTGHLRRAASQKMPGPLRADATDAEKAAHRQMVRALNQTPEKPEGYGIKRPDNVPEEHWSDEFAGHMAKVFHEQDLPPAAAKAIVEGWSQFQNDAFAALQAHEQNQAAEKLANANAMLDQAFGIRRPAMEQLAVRGALAAGLDPNSSAFKDTPEVVIAMARVAQALGEDKLPRPEGAPGGGLDAKAEYEAMHRDPSHRYYAAIQAMARGEQHPLAHEAMQRRNFLAEQVARRQGG